MQNRIANLLTVKSIVTIVLTAVFSVLALRGSISGTEFLTIFTTIIAFYFGTQTEKKKNEEVSWHPDRVGGRGARRRGA